MGLDDQWVAKAACWTMHMPMPMLGFFLPFQFPVHISRHTTCPRSFLRIGGFMLILTKYPHSRTFLCTLYLYLPLAFHILCNTPYLLPQYCVVVLRLSHWQTVLCWMVTTQKYYTQNSSRTPP